MSLTGTWRGVVIVSVLAGAGLTGRAAGGVASLMAVAMCCCCEIVSCSFSKFSVLSFNVRSVSYSLELSDSAGASQSALKVCGVG